MADRIIEGINDDYTIYTWFLNHRGYVLLEFYRVSSGKRIIRLVKREWCIESANVLLDGDVAHREGVGYVKSMLRYVRDEGLDLEVKRGYLVVVYLK